jgi:superoxide reductase
VSRVGEIYQVSNWKTEKHVAVIECPDSIPYGSLAEIEVSVGKEVSHPNTTTHHIRWIQIYFQPKGEKFNYQLANVEFTAHGESHSGANVGSVCTLHAGCGGHV